MGRLKERGLYLSGAEGICALSTAAIGLLSLLACGCSISEWVHNGFRVGPDYVCPPVSEVADHWIDDDDERVIPCPPDYPDWWSVFQDPILNSLIFSAYEQNLSLREAGWRVMQARARRAITAGNLFPQTQQGFGEYVRIQESKSVALPAPLRAFDQWSTGFNLAWELDVWGRFRRAIASADADLEASVGDYDAILTSLIGEVATAYADYRTFEERLEYARENVRIQEGSLRLAQEKAVAGKTGDIGVHLAKSSLESTSATIPSLEIGLRQAGNRLCTLLGLPTTDVAEMLGPGDIPAAPAEVAVGIPADLLRRRPDVRAAERAVAAQSEQIGIAKADLYPHFVISGVFALESEDFADLFTSASSSGSVGPSAQWDLLNYGRIINNVGLQDSRLRELITSYQNTVLTANQEVEDALVAFLRSQERVRFLEANVIETEEALKLLTLSFWEGDISFTGVFVIQADLAAKQDQLAQARGEIATSLINLYRALGGGWEIRCPGVELRGVVSQPLGILQSVPTPEVIPPLPASGDDEPPLPPAAVSPDPMTDDAD
jgi:NodT family efflux transporter outer membrane factor (OMF) lipoprotein